MKRTVTHYVEKIYNRSQIDANGGREVCRVESRDPLMIDEEKDLIGFRFFDVKKTKHDDNHKDDFGPLTNYSGMFYFGERVAYRDLIFAADGDFIKKLQLDYMNRFELSEAIFCEKSGRVISCINEDDKTIEEVKIERVNEQANAIFISQKDFLSGIGCVLEANGNYIDAITSDVVCPISDTITGDSVDSMISIVRTYDLYVNGYKTISSSGIINDDRLGLISRDTYFRLSDAETLVSPLYQEFPYLEGTMYKLKLALANGSDNVDVKGILTGEEKKLNNDRYYISYCKSF